MSDDKNTRIYRVVHMDSEEIESDRPPHLVSANHPSVAVRHVARSHFAVRHVARSHFAVRVASQDDLVTAIRAGVTVEEAGAEPL